MPMCHRQWNGWTSTAYFEPLVLQGVLYWLSFLGARARRSKEVAIGYAKVATMPQRHTLIMSASVTCIQQLRQECITPLDPEGCAGAQL
jgi:hypothetical protein